MYALGSVQMLFKWVRMCIVCVYVCALYVCMYVHCMCVRVCIVCVYVCALYVCTYVHCMCVHVCRGVIECITDATSKQSPCWGRINMSKGDKARWKALKEILPLEVRIYVRSIVIKIFTTWDIMYVIVLFSQPYLHEEHLQVFSTTVRMYTSILVRHMYVRTGHDVHAVIDYPVLMHCHLPPLPIWCHLCSAE